MQLEIISPEKVVYKGDVDQITVHTADGKIAILPHHVNLFTQVVPGELILKIGGRDQLLAITGGFLEVGSNKVTILADYAVHAQDVDVEKSLAAQKRAEELLKKKESQLNEKDFAEIQADLRKAILELRVAHHRKQKPLQQS